MHAMDAWPFTQGGKPIGKRIGGRLAANSVDTVRGACIAGAGLALLTFWGVARDLAGGTLVAVTLEDAEPELLAIWAVLPPRQHTPARVRRFLDVMKEELATRTRSRTP
jgi:DNA-binding transcriptional LysR family regulator